jgi:hypothetical protein
MRTKTIKIKVDRHVAQKYLTAIDNGESITDEKVDPEIGKVMMLVYQSY